MSTLEALLKAAHQAQKRAYVPYSDYPVGAALETDDGHIFTGCNVENAAYPQSMCAERVAVFKAVSEGHRAIRRLVVVTEDGGTPCGGCRSVLAEFGDPETEVITVDRHGHQRRYTLGQLLPKAFEFQHRPRAGKSE